MEYLYETHLHTLPVSRCGHFGVRENLEFYKKMGYEGVFITNHFIDSYKDKRSVGNYEVDLQYYFSDYEQGLKIGSELGLKVFLGIETTYGGTDFLVYGLDKTWFLSHPEIMEMKKSDELPFMMAEGALVVQAHPYREAGYIDHIRLYPRAVHGVEIVNACRTELENRMAEQYARAYDLLPFAGSDNHIAGKLTGLAGMESERPMADEADFVKSVLAGELSVFTLER